jgi:hypothetical protein
MLKYDAPLSNYDFCFNLRLYSQLAVAEAELAQKRADAAAERARLALAAIERGE